MTFCPTSSIIVIKDFHFILRFLWSFLVFAGRLPINFIIPLPPPRKMCFILCLHKNNLHVIWFHSRTLIYRIWIRFWVKVCFLYPKKSSFLLSRRLLNAFCVNLFTLFHIFHFRSFGTGNPLCKSLSTM